MSPDHPDCPNREQLSEYLAGRLSEEASEAIAAHVETCPDCAAAIETIEEGDDTLIARLRDPSAWNPYAKEPECRAAMAQAKAMMDRPGRGAVLGEYELLEELGRGSMGRVYKARHAKLDRLAAVKILPQGRAADARAIARFEREMQAVGRVVHPNIVQAYDAREIDGIPVLIMEYVAGLNLAHVVRRLGRVPVAESCELIRRTALALDCAHRHGLVHRDVKPSNIMLTDAGDVKLLDLGLARLDLGASDGEMTHADHVIGTPEYMAPEQAADGRTADVRADIYSLGRTLFKLLTGRVPHSDLGRYTAANDPDVPAASDLPAGLAAVLNRMTARNPGERFATAAEAAAALGPWCAGADLGALSRRAAEAEGRLESADATAAFGSRTADAVAGPSPRPRARGWKFVTAAACVLLLVGGSVVWLGILLNAPKDAVSAAERAEMQESRAAPANAAAAAPPAETAAATLPPTPNAPTTNTDLLKKLRYAWKKGQAFVYRVRIVGDRGNDLENRSGLVTYTVKSNQYDEIHLAMKSDMQCESTVRPSRYTLLPGRHVGFVSHSDGKRESSIRIDPTGRILEAKGETPLPYLLGDLAELIVEPLRERESWTVENDPGLAVVSLEYPFWRFSQPGFREGVPAVEKTDYTVLEASDKLITIAKHYAMHSAATLGGKPRIEAVGDGKLQFDVARGAPAALDFNITVTVRDSNKTEETPLHLTYRLLSEEDLAQAKQDARREREEAAQAERERARPLSDEEMALVLADLESDDPKRNADGADRLAAKKPAGPNPPVAKALEAVLLKGNDRHYYGAGKAAAAALKNWATADSIPALVKVLDGDYWPPTKAEAIEALGRHAPNEAIQSVARQLNQPFTRVAAAKYLKAAGPQAEDAVLPHLDDKSDWVRADVCEILHAVGGRKSIPALEKALADASWMVNGNARKALAAVKARVEAEPKE